MNEPLSRLPSDELIRASLAREPSTGLADAVGRDLALRLGVTRQRGPLPLWWPWAPSLPGLARSPSQRTFRGVAILVAVGLLVVLSIAIIGIVGSFHRLPPPIGLARPGLIAFDTDGDIVVANVDGTGRRQLTSSAELDIQPTFSPDGTRIAFQSLALGGAIVELVVMDADGGHRMTVATKPASIGNGQATSIDWRLLSWSPDSRVLAYTGLAGGRPQIFLAQADGSGSTLIGDRALEGQDPAWSPDGAHIAFRGGRYDKDRGLYVMNADGSGVRRLTSPQEDAAGSTHSFFAPMWSPDERWIAYTKVLGSSDRQVWVVGVGDGVERAISKAGGYDDAPSWSPDGSRLAYFRSPHPITSFGRFVVGRPDGSGEIELSPPVGGSPVGTMDISGNDAPTWSPDGTKLIGRLYETTFPYSSSIVVIDIAKGTLTVLPPSGSNDADFIEIPGLPSWQRLAP